MKMVKHIVVLYDKGETGVIIVNPKETTKFKTVI